MITNIRPDDGSFEEWLDDTLKTARRKRKELLGELLTEGEQPTDNDVKLADPAVRAWVAGGPLEGPIEFREHECWRMLYVWPDGVDPSKPGRVECPGCGWTGRIEEEYTP